MLGFVHFKVRQARITVLRVVEMSLFHRLLSNAKVQQRDCCGARRRHAAIERLRQMKQNAFPLIAKQSSESACRPDLAQQCHGSCGQQMTVALVQDKQ
jgi:hypothetical protein